MTYTFSWFIIIHFVTGPTVEIQIQGIYILQTGITVKTESSSVKIVKVSPGASGASDGMSTHAQSFAFPPPSLYKVGFECPHHILVFLPLNLTS